MASTSTDTKHLFCVCFKDIERGKRIFLNFISDPREVSSIKLPSLMIELSRWPEKYHNQLGDGPEWTRNRRQIEAAVSGSLDAWYRDKMPRIYLTDKAKDLVMNVYIHEAHSEGLKAIPFAKLIKVGFFATVLSTIQERVLFVARDEKIREIRSNFRPELDGKMKASGRRATKEEICQTLLGSEAAQEQPPSSSIKPEDQILCFGMRDGDQKRNIYYNVVASAHPNSIRLPDLMVDLSKGSFDARIFVRSGNPKEIHQIVGVQIFECLEKFFGQRKPEFYLAKDSDRHLVINVPVRLDQANMLKKSLTGEVRWGFFGGITDTIRKILCLNSRRADLRPNQNMQPLDVPMRYKETGRLATEEEVNSLMLSGAPRQYSLIELMLEGFI